MPDFSKRSTAPEIMDDLECNGEHVDRTLREIKKVNALLGGYRVTIHALDTLLLTGKISRDKCIRIADLGCGGGDMLQKVSQWARKRGVNVRLTGIDANRHIIDFAKEQCRKDFQIKFKVLNVLDRELEDLEQDIYLCTLFLHHFNGAQLEALMSRLTRNAKVGIIVNDLHRNPIAYYAIRLIATVISKSSMFRYDAPLSVLRAFKKKDLIGIGTKLNGASFRLRWRWAFRWQMIVQKDQIGL